MTEPNDHRTIIIVIAMIAIDICLIVAHGDGWLRNDIISQVSQGIMYGAWGSLFVSWAGSEQWNI